MRDVTIMNPTFAVRSQSRRSEVLRGYCIFLTILGIISSGCARSPERRAESYYRQALARSYKSYDDKALEKVNAAIALNPSETRYLWKAAQILRYLNRREEALSHAKKALALNEESSLGNERLCFELGLFSASLTAFERNLQFKKNAEFDPHTRVWIARNLSALGRHTEAASRYKEALNIARNSRKLQEIIEGVMRKDGLEWHYKETVAQEKLLHALWALELTKAPETTRTTTVDGEISKIILPNEEALGSAYDDLKELLRNLRPSFEEAKRVARARSEEAQRQVLAERARTERERIERHLQDCRSYRANRGALKSNTRDLILQAEALAESQQYDEAVGRYRSALGDAPWHGDARFNLAKVLGAMKRYNEAIHEMRCYVELAPTPSEAQEAKDQITKWEAVR